MSRKTKIKYIKPSVEVRKTARWIYQSWDEALQEHAGRKGTFMPYDLRSDTTSLEEKSLAAAICIWVQEQGEYAEAIWKQLLEKIPTSHFLKHGYRNLIAPNLSWLFEYTNSGRGLTRVLDGAYDKYRGYGFFSPDEGI